ncbi:MAG TPA: tRNA-dihydrouridine synthase [Candidatus Paceibacterota bacterium]|nr:tRNA-dihydrouridine synthase [Candidatus Paceibacterota bacterium]
MNFWQKLKEQKRPFFILAPMADVTDLAFRQIVTECGRPDVFYTEFVSTDGLCSDKGRPRLLPHLKFAENERPIVAQFFGSKPENFRQCAELAVELGFDGIDINMGCPDRKIMKQGSGASLVLNPELAQKIVAETKRGAGQLPVSVKTRLGYDKIVTDAWMRALVNSEPAAILLHGRTAKEMSKVPAHWDEIGKAAAIVREAGIPFVGNGDVGSYQEGIEKADEYGLDGIMVGRGIFSNPWFFNSNIDPLQKTKEERIALLRRHVELFTELWGENKNFDVLKRFFKIYIKDFDGSKELRDKLMTARSKEDVEMILSENMV